MAHSSSSSREEEEDRGSGPLAACLSLGPADLVSLVFLLPEMVVA